MIAAVLNKKEIDRRETAQAIRANDRILNGVKKIGFHAVFFPLSNPYVLKYERKSR
jgi:hypothetical protein